MAGLHSFFLAFDFLSYVGHYASTEYNNHMMKLIFLSLGSHYLVKYQLVNDFNLKSLWYMIFKIKCLSTLILFHDVILLSYSQHGLATTVYDGGYFCTIQSFEDNSSSLHIFLIISNRISHTQLWHSMF